MSSGSRLFLPSLSSLPAPIPAPPVSRRGRGTKRKKGGPEGAGGDKAPSGMNPGAAMSS